MYNLIYVIKDISSLDLLYSVRSVVRQTLEKDVTVRITSRGPLCLCLFA